MPLHPSVAGDRRDPRTDHHSNRHDSKVAGLARAGNRSRSQNKPGRRRHCGGNTSPAHRRNMELVSIRRDSYTEEVTSIRYADTGTVVRWPGRAVGPVVVDATILFREGPVRSRLIVGRPGLRRLTGEIATLGSRQQQGARADDLLWQAARRLALNLAHWSEAVRQGSSVPCWDMVAVGGPRGLPRRVVRVLPNPGSAYTLQTRGRLYSILVIQREDLLRLSEVVARPDGVELLKFAVRVWLLPDELLQWAAHLPRGRSMLSWPLRCHLSAAFWFADTLVRATEKDPALYQKVLDCIVADPQSREYWEIVKDLAERPHHLKLLLVDRAFRGAWEQYGIVRPCEAASDDFEPLRSYRYGARTEKQRRALTALASADPDWETHVLYFAEAMLLGPPGSLAVSYGLDVRPAAS